MRTLLATPFVWLIRLYQKTLSPDHGPLKFLYPHGYCRHEPTCSEFAVRELKQKPILPALWSALKRLGSCHPWASVSDEKLRAVIQKHL